MAAKTLAEIKPSGMTRRDEVDLLYDIISSIKGICAKADDDTGAADTDFESLIYTGIFNGHIEDSQGNMLQNRVAAKDQYFYSITPTGISEADRVEILYDIFDMLQTLTAKLDDDGTVTDTDYESLCYTTLILKMVTNQKGNTLGNGNTFWFNPGGASPRLHLVDLYYQILNALSTLTTKMDADLTDTDYKSLWFTATCLLTVEDSAASRIGN